MILKGKLTYICAGLAILWGVYGLLSGFVDNITAMNAIWTGAAVFGLRRAM